MSGRSQPPGHDYRLPVSDDTKRRLNEIAVLIKERLPEGWGFGLLIFDFGEQGTMTWISNANRQDMLKAMQEFLARQAS